MSLRSMLFVMVCVAGLNGAYAEVKLPPVLSSHMVLQRGVKVPIWGTAAPGENVTVTFRDQEKSTTADAQGKWKVSLDSLQAGGPDVLTVTGSNTLTLEDVLVGEVWLGSGQSNMYGGADQYVMNDEVLTNMVAAGPYPKLRLIRLDSSAWTGWKEATPDNLMTFSALLFSFGCPLQKDLNVPVGLLVGAAAGKPSGFFLSQEAFNSDPACQDLVNSDPTGVVGTTWYGVIGELYETIIRPGIPYAIRGVLWDQGESGTGIKGIDQYTVMGALIKGWRKDWGQPPTPHSAGSGQADSGLPGDFPFIYVQKWSGGGCAWDNTDPVTSKGESLLPLPSVYPDYPKLGFIDYLKIRNYTNTFMSTSSDLGSGMHPVNKSGYGARAARVALGGVYGKDVEIYGPVYNSQKIVGDKVIISFDHLGLGLAFKTNELVDKLQGFRISGDAETYNYNRPRFFWADAVIEGDTVVVSSALVTNPVAVRWAWLDDRRWANLFNLDGLPALPFSTYGIPAPQQLLLSLPAVATEGDGVLVGNGSVTLSAVQETNAVVTLASLNTGKVTVPASVTILAGQLSATFDVTIVDDTVMNGPQTAVITATARGLGLDAGGISVQDNDSGVMVTAPPNTTEGIGTIQGTVTISPAQAVPVTVELSSSDTNAVQVPAGVVIPAGQTSVPFTITVVDDNKIDGTQTATLTARVQGWMDGTASIAVLDNDLPALTWGGNGDGIWTNLDGDGDWQAATYTNGDNVTFNDTATGTIIVSGGTVNPGNITVNSTNKNYIINAGMVSIGSLTKQGSKPLILGGNNSFSKLTVSGPGVVVITNSTVLSGKAQVGDDVAGNSSATLVVTNGAYLASTSGSIGSSDNSAWSIQYHRGLVGGGSSANKAVWNLSGGGLVIGGGGNNNAYNSLKIDQGGMVTNAGAITLGLSYGCYDNYMIITNGGYLASTGTAIIGNQNVASRNYVYIGGASGSTHSIWNLGGATLQIGKTSQSVNNWMTVGVGGTLTNVSTLTLGVGTNSIFNLSGGDAYVSTINLSLASAALNFTNGGVLHASASGNLLSGSGTNYFLAGGGTIDTAGFTVTNSVVNAGTGGMTKTGSGKLVLTSTNTSVGAIVINGGTLALQATNSLSTGTDLYIVTGATNLLNYTGEQYIHAVYINGKLQKHSPITTLNSAPYFVGEGKLIPAVVGPPEGTVISIF